MTSDVTRTVSLVFTDMVGSTRLLQAMGDAYPALLADHHRMVADAAARHGGTQVDAAGDGLFLSFPTVRGALLACIDVQRVMAAHPWPPDATVEVRIGLHTGEPVQADARYVGIDVHRASRISAAGHGGQILVSEAARALLGPTLPDGVSLLDLGDHHLKDLAEPERLYQVVADGLRSDFPPVRSLDNLPNNLPRQLSTFIGRAHEMASAEERLAEARLLTLTGTGGVGKTRLALEIGAHLVTSFPDGVWFVELASLTDGDLVDDAVATALRVKQRPNTEIIDALDDEIGERHLLVILDNCEHLIEPVVALVDELLHRCPSLKVLATSREALGIPGEGLVPVSSMTLPPLDATARDLDVLAQCDAVRLFVDRARAAAPTFVLSAANAESVAQICRRLDGIPLAVELAAARVRSLPPAQIAARLDDRFRLLTGGSRTALPRHRTLRAAMDWSFELLGPPEQAILPRLAVFAGSFSLEAAEAVVSDTDVPSEDVLDLLGRLVDRSLLLAEDREGEARYRMLETIRDYAQERLAESGEAAARHARHRDWCVDLVERARPEFFSGAVQAESITRLAADHDNLRAALSWTHEDPDGADAELALVSGLWRFWELRGDFEEGSAWLERALERVGDHVSHRRAGALTGAGVLAAHRGNLAQAAAFHEASLQLNRQLGGAIGIASACSNLANIAIARNDLDRARELYAESIELSRPHDPHGTAFTMVNLADLTARGGDEAEADRLFAECIDLFERVGDEWGFAHASTRLASAARRRGDLETARRRFADALAIHRRTGDRHAEARVLANVADVAADLGDLADAEALYQQSLAIRSELGDRLGIATVLERLAGVAEDRPERAAALLGAAEAMRVAIGAPLTAAGLARLDQFIAALHTTAGSAAVDRGLAEGRSAPLARTLARAAGRD